MVRKIGRRADKISAEPGFCIAYSDTKVGLF
jgi:hypothetical protein